MLGMFGFGVWELSIVLGIVLLLFGTRLPIVARSLGQSINAFKKGVQDADDDKETDKIE